MWLLWPHTVRPVDEAPLYIHSEDEASVPWLNASWDDWRHQLHLNDATGEGLPVSHRYQLCGVLVTRVQQGQHVANGN